MTYLELLMMVKAGTQPKYVERNEECFKWNGRNYARANGTYLADTLHETDMVSKNNIKILVYGDK